MVTKKGMAIVNKVCKRKKAKVIKASNAINSDKELLVIA